MPKFNPLDFEHELVGEQDEIIHYQRKVEKNKPPVIYELAYYKKEHVWLIFIESTNLNPYLSNQQQISETYKIPLYIGKINSYNDFRFIMKRIAKKPELIVKLGS